MSTPVPFGFPFVGTAQTNAALSMSETVARDVARQPPPPDTDRPWMRIDNRYAGTGQYSWTMQAVAADGSFYNHPNGVVGTVAGLDGATQTVLPAEEMNGNTITSFPFYVRGERAIGGVTTGGVIYRFAANAGGVEVGEPHSSGTTPPTGYLDWRIVNVDTTTAPATLTGGENIWLVDANA